MPTGHGSIIHVDNRPTYDAPCVALCRAEGALILGKTVTSEFAHITPGKTKNPHKKEHSPGGSSSGSAAAVADFMVPVAYGTQTGGSIIRPAAFNGCIGYKPSYGDYNSLGVHDNTRSFDTLGLLSRTMEDQVLMRAVTMGLPHRPIQTMMVSQLKIGLCRTPNWKHADKATQCYVEDASETLSKLGATVVNFTLPEKFDELENAFDVVNAFEFSRALAYEWHTCREFLSDRVKENRLIFGWNLDYQTYRDGLTVIKEYRDQFHYAFCGFDLLITPSANGKAPPDLTTIGETYLNRVWTAVHSPCISLPLFTGPTNLPIGLQLIGPLGKDEQFLHVANSVYLALGEHAHSALSY